MVQFHDTIMGQRFLQGTMPKLVQELERLNKNLEEMNELKLQEIMIKERELDERRS